MPGLLPGDSVLPELTVMLRGIARSAERAEDGRRGGAPDGHSGRGRSAERSIHEEDALIDVQGRSRPDDADSGPGWG